MTKDEAKAIVNSLTERQKIMLYQLLSDLQQNQEPVAPDPAKD